MFIKKEVKKNSLDEAKKQERLVKLAEAVQRNTIKIRDGMPMGRIVAVRSTSVLTDICNDKKAIRKAHGTDTYSDESGLRHYLTHLQGRRSR